MSSEDIKSHWVEYAAKKNGIPAFFAGFDKDCPGDMTNKVLLSVDFDDRCHGGDKRNGAMPGAAKGIAP